MWSILLLLLLHYRWKFITFFYILQCGVQQFWSINFILKLKWIDSFSKKFSRSRQIFLLLKHFSRLLETFVHLKNASWRFNDEGLFSEPVIISFKLNNEKLFLFLFRFCFCSIAIPWKKKKSIYCTRFRLSVSLFFQIQIRYPTGWATVSVTLFQCQCYGYSEIVVPRIFYTGTSTETLATVFLGDSSDLLFYFQKEIICKFLRIVISCYAKNIFYSDKL